MTQLLYNDIEVIWV